MRRWKPWKPSVTAGKNSWRPYAGFPIYPSACLSEPVNSVFLTMAIQAGLTMAIANPSSELLVASAFASDMLLHKEGSDLRYIEFANAYAAS